MSLSAPMGGVRESDRVGRDRAPDDPGRHESKEEREDRNLNELLQELRVAALAVQVLFGFLLSLPWSSRFARLSLGQRHLYMATLLLAALATALLTGPVAYHRQVFRRHRKERLVRTANTMALAGLGAVGLAINCAVALVATQVAPGSAAIVVGVTAGAFTMLWVVVPLSGRLRRNW